MTEKYKDLYLKGSTYEKYEAQEERNRLENFKRIVGNSNQFSEIVNDEDLMHQLGDKEIKIQGITFKYAGSSAESFKEILNGKVPFIDYCAYENEEEAINELGYAEIRIFCNIIPEFKNVEVKVE